MKTLEQKRPNPQYFYIIEKEGEQYEFDSYAQMVHEVQIWDDIENTINDFESNFDEKFTEREEDSRQDWIYDTMDEILDAAGYSLEKVLK